MMGMKRTVLFAAIVTACAGLVVWALLRTAPQRSQRSVDSSSSLSARESGSGEIDSPLPEPVPGARLQGSTVTETADRAALGGPGPGDPPAALLDGWVRTEEGLSIDATLRYGDRSAFSDLRRGGRFLLEVPPRQPGVLMVEAPGFRPMQKPLTPSPGRNELGVLVLELEGDRVLTVLEPSGAPVPEALVEILPRKPAGDPYGPRIPPVAFAPLGTTDEGGRLEIALGADELVVARKGDRCSTVRTIGPRDGDMVIRLPEGSTRCVGLRDGSTGQGIPHVRLLATLSGVDAKMIVTTDEDGLVNRPVPPGSYVLQDWMKRIRVPSIGPPATSREIFLGSSQPSPFEVSVTVLPGAPIEWLTVEALPGLTVRAVDAATGEPIQPLYTWWSTYQEELSRTLHTDVSFFADGEASVYRNGYTRVASDWPHWRLYAGSPGYRSAYIEDPKHAILPDVPFVLSLDRSWMRSIRAVRQDGGPVLERLFVRAGEEGGEILLAQGIPDLDTGLLGPFPWDGGDVYVRRSEVSGRRGRPVRIEARALETEEPPTVEIETGGRIEVTVPPDVPPRLVCAGKEGVLHTGMLVGDRLVFDRLAPGRYAVGPPGQLETGPVTLGDFFRANRQGFPIQLESGATVRIAWDPAWAPPGEVTGTVLAPGMDLERILVIPRMEELKGNLALNPHDRTYPIDREGVFTIRGLSSRPSSFLFVRPWEDGSLLPLGVGVPGSTSLLECARVIVDISGIASGPEVRVTCVPEIEGYTIFWTTRYQIGSSHGGKIDLGWLPVGTQGIEIESEGRRKTLLFELEPGQLLDMSVSLGEGDQDPPLRTNEPRLEILGPDRE